MPRMQYTCDDDQCMCTICYREESDEKADDQMEDEEDNDINEQKNFKQKNK